MHILEIYNTQNTVPRHQNDAGGAFIPESYNFAKYRESQGDTVTRVGYRNMAPADIKRAEVFGIIEKAEPFDAFVYLGHGLRNSLSSAGIDQAHRREFTKLLAKKARSKRLIVTLYACSTGETTTKEAEGEGGFADRVRDDLTADGFLGWVDGHTVPGHTTQNSRLRRFAMDPADTTGGDWLVDPTSPEFRRWKARLGAKWKNDPFRFMFPFLTTDAVRAACR